jgi:hypothetical protein
MFAAKILGRAIDAVRRGFDQDPELPAQLSVYRAIQDKYPESTVTVKEMYDSIDNRIRKREARAKVTGLSPEQEAIWKQGNEGSESAELLASIPNMLTLLVAADPDLDAWKEMPVVAQWAIISSVERSLDDKVKFYKSKGGTNFLSLAAQIEKAKPAFHKQVTSYLAQKKVTSELDLARQAGINVPERVAS